jgi:hypothetical protein
MPFECDILPFPGHFKLVHSPLNLYSVLISASQSVLILGFVHFYTRGTKYCTILSLLVIGWRQNLHQADMMPLINPLFFTLVTTSAV